MVFNDASFQNILFLNKPYFTLTLINFPFPSLSILQ